MVYIAEALMMSPAMALMMWTWMNQKDHASDKSAAVLVKLWARICDNFSRCKGKGHLGPHLGLV